MGGLRELVGKFVDIGPGDEVSKTVKPDKGLTVFDDLVSTTMPVTSTAPAVPVTTPLDWTLELVFQKGGADMGRNSADTVLKLATSLAQFPEAQRLAMIRALDAADETWDEPHVLADAQRRVAILTKFRALIDGDVQERTNQINADFEGAKTTNDGQIADFDRQIALLQQQREALAHETTKAREAADGQITALRSRAEATYQTVQEALDRYAALIKFFGQP